MVLAAYKYRAGCLAAGSQALTPHTQASPVIPGFHCFIMHGLQVLTSQKATNTAKLSDFSKNHSAQVDKTITTPGFFENTQSLLTSAFNTLLSKSASAKGIIKPLEFWVKKTHKTLLEAPNGAFLATEYVFLHKITENKQEIAQTVTAPYSVSVCNSLVSVTLH